MAVLCIKGRIAIWQDLESRSWQTAGTLFIEDAMVMSGYARERAGSTYHKGAGAQELIVMVCRLLSNALTVS